MNIKIRKAVIEDMKYTVPLRMRAWRFAYEGIMDLEYLNKRTDPENFDEMIKRNEENFIDQKEDAVYLVAEVDDKVIGMAFGGNPRNEMRVDKELYALYVEPKYHGFGVGEKLLKAFLEEMGKTGAKHMSVGCLSANKSTGFYKKMGGRVLEECFWEYEKGKLPETFFVFDI